MVHVKWGERRELRAEGGNGPETFKHVHSVHDKQLSGMTRRVQESRGIEGKLILISFCQLYIENIQLNTRNSIKCDIFDCFEDKCFECSKACR